MNCTAVGARMGRINGRCKVAVFDHGICGSVELVWTIGRVLRIIVCILSLRTLKIEHGEMIRWRKL